MLASAKNSWLVIVWDLHDPKKKNNNVDAIVPYRPLPAQQICIECTFYSVQKNNNIEFILANN